MSMIPMRDLPRVFSRPLIALATVTAFHALHAQTAAPPPVRAESVVVTPDAKYTAGGFHTWLWGDNYRALWATPLKVEVLDLHSFAGGLTPLKKGGGMQTESLRFEGADGVEYTFRTVDKLPHLPSGMRGAMATKIMADQVSSEHPTASLVAAPLLQAAGVLHVTPVLRVMPHDTLLGEFSKEFAGRLGTVEESPGHNKKKGGESFAGAHEIIDSDSLRILLDRDSREHIDARAMLAARLMDIYLNDIDRHPGQWKWARLQKGEDAPWEPIPRDRDQAFVAYHGAVIAMARMGAPNLVKFDGEISIPGLTYNSLEMDRRLLASLERPVWDSVATELTRKLTDQVIEGAVHMMPAEYLPTAPAMSATLRLRRDHLRAAATHFYLFLSGVVDVHGTDAADRATITRLENGIVEVKLESRGAPFFLRRFDARETKEVRVYLHGGNDSSVVVGDVFRSIPVKIIGGNGANWLTDSSHVDGRAKPSTIIDQGATEGVSYGKDTLMLRLPFEEVNGKLEPAMRDRGTAVEPMIGVRADLGFGITPRFGLTHYTYGFRERPYASAVGVEAEYAFGVPGYHVSAMADRRFEGTPFHLAATASISTLADLSYHGLGNATGDSAADFFSVRQTQVRVRPAVALALSRTTDLSLGPAFQYTRTADDSGRYLAVARPYGIGNFSEVGMQLALHHEVRDNPEEPTRHFVVDLTGTYYPAAMDLTSAYERVTFRAGQQVTLPILMRPTFVWRGGAEKLYGNFPFFESAFIGGRPTLMRTFPQRYAGDASVFATSELRIPIWNFAFMVPMQAGVIGSAETGKVFVKGSSTGGWHSATGGGLYVGLFNQSFIVSCTVTNESGGAGPHCQTGLHISP